MLSLSGAIESIERAEFSSSLGLANNVDMFRELLGREPAVQALLAYLKQPGNSKILLGRIESLVREQDDIRFRNSRDAAIAVYLWALNATNPPLGRLGASMVLVAPRLWWARKTALAIVSGTSVHTESARGSSGVSLVGQWRTASQGDIKEVMVLGEPPFELIRENRVLDDPSAIKSQGEPDNPSLVDDPKFTTSGAS